ncbi:MAG: UbiX family flavin prenyltransferase [Bacteroidia bacterium]|nr:UbiX family flavin prenyltransferase [Bacteroidia bacterium]
MHSNKKIVIAVSGASGSIYAQKLIAWLYEFKKQNIIQDAALVFSNQAPEVWKHELGSFDRNALPFKTYENNDFNAPFASGSSGYNAMVICPCSVGMMGRIANGSGNDLISRAADVMLKEKRKLILVLRETPLNLIHIKNMETLTLAGAQILPACPSFYSLPKSMDDAVMTVVNRILSNLELSAPNAFRWGEQHNS